MKSIIIQQVARINRIKAISLICSLLLLLMGSIFVQKVFADSEPYTAALEALSAESDAPILLPLIEDAEPEIIISNSDGYLVKLIDSTVVCPQYESCHLATVSVQNLDTAYPRRNENKLVQLNNGVIAQFFMAIPPEVPTFLVFEIEDYQYTLGMPNATEEEITTVANGMFDDEN